MKHNISNLYYFLIPFLVVGISLGFTSFIVALISIVPLLFLSNRHTIGIFFVMYGGPLGGVIRTMYPALPIYGVLLEIIGFVLMWNVVEDLFKSNSKALFLLLITLIVFGVFYLHGPMDAFSSDKYTAMCWHGFIMIFCYYTLDKSCQIDAEGLTRILFVAAICMFTFSVQEYHFQPGSVFDFNWFREQSTMWGDANRNYQNMVITYQHIGMLVAYATTFYLSQIKLKTKHTIYYLLCAMYMVLMSGCRQAILAVVVVVALRFALFKQSNIQNKISIGKITQMLVGIVIVLFAFSFLLQNIGSEIISSTLSEGDKGRQMLYIEAIAIIIDHPIIGVGLGGFHAITDEGWPHNFFLELLCEVGIIGTIILLLILIVSFYQKHSKILYVNKSNMFYFLIVMILLVRLMVSSDLSESIEFFSAVFAVSPANNDVIKRQSLSLEISA